MPEAQQEHIIVIADDNASTSDAIRQQIERNTAKPSWPTQIITINTREELLRILADDAFTSDAIAAAIVRDPLHGEKLGPAFFAQCKGMKEVQYMGSGLNPMYIAANIPQGPSYAIRRWQLLDAGVDRIFTFQETDILCPIPAPFRRVIASVHRYLRKRRIPHDPPRPHLWYPPHQ